VGSNLVVLPENYLDASRLLQPSCGAARAGLSSLVEVGRGGLPPDPDGYLPSAGPVMPPAAEPASAGAASSTPATVLAQLGCSK